MVLSGRNSILSLQAICLHEILDERQSGVSPVQAGLWHQPDFSEIFYCSGVNRGAKPLEHVFLGQMHKSRMLPLKFFEIIKYFFCDGVNHIIRPLGGSAQGGDNTEYFYVYQIFRTRIELSHRNCRIGVVMFISDQFNKAFLYLSRQNYTNVSSKSSCLKKIFQIDIDRLSGESCRSLLRPNFRTIDTCWLHTYFSYTLFCQFEHFLRV